MKVFKNTLIKIHILFFINGVLLGLLVYFYSENSYENKLFKNLAETVKKSTISFKRDSLIVNVRHLVHNVIMDRDTLFPENIGGLKAGIINPASVDLMTGQGSCGSYTIVMARLLQEFDIKTRIIQMKVNGLSGGHIILEAQGDEQMIVCDPLYDLSFIRSDNKLASIWDVMKNWNSYISQLPKSYNRSFSYEDFRYTNWNKIPLLMPAVKACLDIILGKEHADRISLRVFFLQKFKLLFIFTLIVYLFTSFRLVMLFLHKSTKSEDASGKLQAYNPKITLIERTPKNVSIRDDE